MWGEFAHLEHIAAVRKAILGDNILSQRRIGMKVYWLSGFHARLDAVAERLNKVLQYWFEASYGCF